MKITTESETETKNVAKRFIKEEIKNKKGKESVVVSLKGDLGSGKTTFIKGISEALKIKTHVTSPTFLIIQKYPLDIEGFDFLFHIDAYRIEDPKEILNLNFKDIISNKKHIVMIEWGNKIKSIIPKNATWIYFNHGKEKNERTININNNGKRK